MDRQHDLIDYSIFVDDLAHPLVVRWKLRWLAVSAENTIGHRDGRFARDPNQSDGAFAGRSRNRGDCFARRHQLSRRHYADRLFNTSRNAVMHCRFCSIVPIEIRTHSARS